MKKLQKNGIIDLGKYSSLFSLSMALLLFGVLFKIQHWPSANILIVSGYGIAFLTFLYKILRSQKINPIDIIATIGIGILLAQKLFHFFEIPHFGTVRFILIMLGGTFLTVKFVQLLRNKKTNVPSLVLFISTLGALLMIVGAFLKMQHLLGAGVMIVLGMAICAFSFIYPRTT